MVASEGKLSASFDGLTMDETICFEHKSLNNSIRESLGKAEIPEQYRAQMEQQLMISGAYQCLFMASKWDGDALVEELHSWYESDPAMRERIMQGWTQFAIDLETHQPKIIIEKPKADVAIELPALYINAHGAITSSNMAEYGVALKARLAEVRAIKLITDLDFSNAKAGAKMFREQCQKLKLAKEAMLAQTVTIGEAARMMDSWHEDLRQTALQLEKDVEREDLAKKRAMLAEITLAYSAHVSALESETTPIRLSVKQPDFAGSIKGKSSFASMQSALSDALANAKIEADAHALDIRRKLEWFRASSSEHKMLFPDFPQIIVKQTDDFRLLVDTRIAAYKMEQAAKLESERVRIQVQEEAKARAKVEAEEQVEKVEADRARFLTSLEVRARAKVDAEDQAKAKVEAESVRIIAENNLEKGRLITINSEVKTLLDAEPITRPTDVQIILVIAQEFDCTHEEACNWICEVAENINYQES